MLGNAGSRGQVDSRHAGVGAQGCDCARLGTSAGPSAVDAEPDGSAAIDGMHLSLPSVVAMLDGDERAARKAAQRLWREADQGAAASHPWLADVVPALARALCSGNAPSGLAAMGAIQSLASDDGAHSPLLAAGVVPAISRTWPSASDSWRLLAAATLRHLCQANQGRCEMHDEAVPTIIGGSLLGVSGETAAMCALVLWALARDPHGCLVVARSGACELLARLVHRDPCGCATAYALGALCTVAADEACLSIIATGWTTRAACAGLSHPARRTLARAARLADHLSREAASLRLMRDEEAMLRKLDQVSRAGDDAAATRARAALERVRGGQAED